MDAKSIHFRGMEKPKDRDFIETIEGLIFCIVGYIHPPDRYTAYLKYIPNPNGLWSREGTRYARAIPYYHVSQVEKTYDYLQEHHPHYIHRCPVRNITVSSVPYKSVKRYYRPRSRLKSILRDGPRDKLEGKLIDLLAYLNAFSGLGVKDQGVTGSLLTGNHSPVFSDIDITVYGKRATSRLKETIVGVREEGSSIQPFSTAKKEDWSRTRSKRFPLGFDDLMELAERRWNYGIFRGTYFSVHPVRTDSEITEAYGDFTYEKKGVVTGKAEISDSSESIYLPAIYKLTDVKTDRRGDVEITMIVSYEGLFCNAFKAGERIEFRGVLEQVNDGKDHYRVVIGGAGSSPDYLKLAV